MNIQQWDNKQKIIASAVFIAFYAFLKLGGINAIFQFLLVGAIPGTQYSLPAGIMLIFYGTTIWMLFCHRTAMHYIRQALEKQNLSSPSTSLPRRRYSELS